MGLATSGEFFCIESNLFLAKDIRWSFKGTKPVQSCKSLMLMYLGQLIMARNAMFWISWSFSKCTSAAFIMHMLLYSKMGTISDWYSCARMFGLGSLASDRIRRIRFSLL